MTEVEVLDLSSKSRVMDHDRCRSPRSSSSSETGDYVVDRHHHYQHDKQHQQPQNRILSDRPSSNGSSQSVRLKSETEQYSSIPKNRNRPPEPEVNTITNRCDIWRREVDLSRSLTSSSSTNVPPFAAFSQVPSLFGVYPPYQQPSSGLGAVTSAGIPFYPAGLQSSASLPKFQTNGSPINSYFPHRRRRRKSSTIRESLATYSTDGQRSEDSAGETGSTGRPVCSSSGGELGSFDDKDSAYVERRRKNNEAAKRSRDARRMKEEQVARRAQELEEENVRLRTELEMLKTESAKLHFLLYSKIEMQR